MRNEPDASEATTVARGDGGKPATTLRSGDVIECDIDKVVYRGLGLARLSGRVVFVRGGYPGERWRVRIAEVTPDFAHGEGLEPIVTSSARRVSPCRAFRTCGGCTHLDLRYPNQLRLKAEILSEVLARAGVRWESEIAIAPSPESGWRCRASLHCESGRTDLRIGFTEAASHRVVEIDTCLQLSPSLNAALADLRRALAQQAALAQGTRRIELVESGCGDRRIATLIGDFGSGLRRELSRLADGLPAFDALGVVSDKSHAQDGIWSRAPLVVSTVHGYAFRTHARTFFQANRFLTEELVTAVERGVSRCEVVVDLYSGAGLFSLPLATKAARVLGVEVNPFAVRDARANARAAGLTNIEFVRGDACRILAGLAPHSDETIVVDPPRGGLPRELVSALQERRPGSIVYVSCDPPTLARDLARLTHAGYQIRSIEGLDMFPGTYHIESVACLAR